jgi:uncharacterized phage protein (TIGR02220 family)
MEEQTLFGDVEELKPISRNVLDYLNLKKPTKIAYKPTPANLKGIEARIKEGFTIDDFKEVIDFKIKEWKDVPKMQKYIRPDTLFGGKFNQYLVDANEYKIQNDGSQNFELNPQAKAKLV